MKLILVFSLLSLNLFSQKEFNISFGESIKLHREYEKSIFTFFDQGKKMELSIVEFDQYIFNYPGIFKIEISHKKGVNHSSCEHHGIPKELNIHVDSIKFNFIENTLRISKKIIQNQSTVGTILSINIEVYNYYKSRIKLKLSDIETAGIGTDIKASIENRNLEGMSGSYSLSYNLTGSCEYPNAIQFDFKNHRDEITPIAFLESIISNK